MQNIAIIILSIIIAGSFIFEYKKMRLILKLVLAIFIILGNIASFYYQEQEKVKERKVRASIEWNEDYRAQQIKNAIMELKEEEDIFSTAIPETASSFFDRNYSRLKDVLGTNKKIREHYLTIYFSEVDKIPDFYNLEEWKDTERILFGNMHKSLKGYFINRGRSEYGRTIAQEFAEAREKCVKAKEREFNK